jgi:hypothetical protein
MADIKKTEKTAKKVLTKRGGFGILTKLSLRQVLRQGAAEKQSRDLKKAVDKQRKVW